MVHYCSRILYISLYMSWYNSIPSIEVNTKIMSLFFSVKVLSQDLNRVLFSILHLCFWYHYFVRILSFLSWVNWFSRYFLSKLIIKIPEKWRLPILPDHTVDTLWPKKYHSDRLISCDLIMINYACIFVIAFLLCEGEALSEEWSAPSSSININV